jgi:hypothetical protein
MPLAAPPPPPTAHLDAPPPSTPPVDVVDLVHIAASPSVPAPVPAPGSPPAQRWARAGLVLAVVLALAGVVSAVAKSGDDDRSTTASAGARPHADEVDEPQVDEPEVDDPLGAIAPADVPAGFEVRQGDGLSIAVPADWQSLDRSDLEQILTGGVEQLYPDLDRGTRSAMESMAERGALFMAMDTTGPDAGRSINALRVLGEAPLDEIYDAVKAEYAGAGFHAEVLGGERRDTPLGEAMRISVRQTVDGRTLDMVQYCVPFDGHTFIVTGTSTGGIIDTAIQTLRVSDAV